MANTDDLLRRDLFRMLRVLMTDKSRQDNEAVKTPHTQQRLLRFIANDDWICPQQFIQYMNLAVLETNDDDVMSARGRIGTCTRHKPTP